ncbi:hypothetical protein [Candidatus Manganitrophus noduliformans]|uniref:Lipoprotein n=1 Tax=Candidatus Manganitrophus noduliformans TaxID=2606439 RepID=A0A7X6DP23_9BACT|nr:hypothetical protein [Candidatus Manganitrophus noduliformans]NKE70695.1 hypothetical protein [Candidatus Manganitrophus noduliformans]
MKRTFLFFIFGFLFFGCVGIDDLSREDYRRGVLYTSSLSTETIAVMPMVGRGANRDYTKTAEKIFYRALTEMRQQTQLISPEEGRARVEASNLGPLLERLKKELSFKKVAEEKDVAELKKVFGTRFLLQTELQQVEVIEGATHVRLQGRLWDIEMGDIIWEGTGESRGYLFLFFPRIPASFEKAAEVASRGLIKRLP